MNKLLILGSIFAFLCAEIHGARILIIYHVPATSHCNLGEAFARGLSAKGHQVTVISPFKLKRNYPNVKHILLDGVIEKMEKFKDMFQANQTNRFFTQFTQFFDVVEVMTSAALESKTFANLLKTNEKYDLVMLDEFYNKALYGIANHFNASLIVTSSTLSDLTNHITGNPAPFSFVPTMITAFPDKMNFMQRLLNSISGVVGLLLINYIILPTQEIWYRKYFENGPDMQHLINNVSLVFTNTHPVIETPRPYMPNMIPIGGFHIEDPKKLPQDLENFLNTANDGFIYVSLGSTVKSSDLTKERTDAFLKTFAKLPEKVIWKWESDHLENKPENVWTGKWLPQSDILAHPKIKAFVTHGGLLSLTEAMYRNVPVVVIPFFGDQPSNAASVTAAGYGLRLLPEELNEATMTNILQEILTNPKYRNEMNRRSKIINDQPMKPLDTAIYWIEYVLRHKGCRHLHSSAAEIHMFQYLLLDVIGFCTATLVLLISGLYFSIKFCCCRRKINQNENKIKMQ